MTATFNKSLLVILQDIIGIIILNNKYFGHQKKNKNRQIKIEIVSSLQSLRVVKKHATSILNLTLGTNELFIATLLCHWKM